MAVLLDLVCSTHFIFFCISPTMRGSLQVNELPNAFVVGSAGVADAGVVDCEPAIDQSEHFIVPSVFVATG
jgi:hypothetical protein